MRRAAFLLLFFLSISAHAATWRRYAEHGCIGGAECRRNGNRITIALDSAPVIGVRFFAHDDIGPSSGGQLRVRMDDDVLKDYVDVERRGREYTIDGHGHRGRYLVIEPAADDEVVIKDVRVRYERY